MYTYCIIFNTNVVMYLCIDYNNYHTITARFRVLHCAMHII